MTDRITSQELTLTDRIEQYIIDNPLCTKKQIVVAMARTPETVAAILTRLSRRGLVRKLILDSGDVLWKAGRNANLPPAERPDRKQIPSVERPRREYTSSWEPHMVRDPLVAALFVQQFHQERESA